MALYVKRLNTGNLSITLNGKRRTTIRAGDLYEGTIEAIPEHFRADFVELSRDEEAKMGKSELKRLAYKFQEEHKLKSVWLNPAFRPNLGAWVSVPKDIIGLKAVQYDLEQQAAEFKLDLQEKWSEWRAVCKRDPMGDEKKLSKPEGAHIENIARAEARMNHVLDELAEVERRILAVEELNVDPRILAEKRRRFFMSGTMKMDKGFYVTVDYFPVIYVKGKPIIPELGDKPLKTYIEEVKIYKQAKAKAKNEVIKKARQEFLDNRMR